MDAMDLLTGLNDVQDRYIAGAERFRQRKRAPAAKRRLWLLAAAVALMLLLIGCAAVVWMNIRNLTLAREEYTRPPYYLENGETVAPEQKTSIVLSLQGIENSKNFRACREWDTFEKGYDPDGKLLAEAENSGFQAPGAYDAYFVYTQEMLDKVDEIAKKYFLRLAGRRILTQTYDQAIFFEVLGIAPLVRDDASAQYADGSFFECGDFDIRFSFTVPQGQSSWGHEIHASCLYTNKAYFRTLSVTLWDLQTVKEWNETLPDGTELLIVRSGETAWLLCDRKDAFLTYQIDTTFGREEMTDQNISAVAQTLNFSVKPKKPNMEDAERQLEASHQKYTEAQLRAPEQTTELPQEDRFCHGSFSELVRDMMDHEDFFAEQLDERYRNFKEECTYALLDVTGDGSGELLTGRDGYVITLWAMENGKTTFLSGSGENYICQGNIWESYIFQDGQPKHIYSQIEPDFHERRIAYVGYDAYHGSWVYSDYSADDKQYISEKKAMEIIHSFPRISLDMKRVEDFPTDGNTP